MRLDDQEKIALHEAIRGIDGEVYLFGSRLDDLKRGGDIDLLIFSGDDPYRLSKEMMIRFQMLCEEKIDVVVMNPDLLSPEQQAFLNLVRKVRIA